MDLVYIKGCIYMYLASGRNDQVFFCLHLTFSTLPLCSQKDSIICLTFLSSVLCLLFKGPPWMKPEQDWSGWMVMKAHLVNSLGLLGNLTWNLEDLVWPWQVTLCSPLSGAMHYSQPSAKAMLVHKVCLRFTICASFLSFDISVFFNSVVCNSAEFTQGVWQKFRKSSQ